MKSYCFILAGLLAARGDLLAADHAPADSLWKHRVEIQVDNTAGSAALSDYQVRLALNPENFDFNLAQRDGRDLRLFDSDGRSPLAFWIERYHADPQEAVLWVKVPAIPAKRTKTVYLACGNPAAEPASDGRKTFDWFDDAEQGEAGQRWEVAAGSPRFEYVAYFDQFGKPGGVWHASGCTRRVSPKANTVYGGAHATYCSWTRPMAVYAPSQEKTFFVFGNAENAPTISCYDHRSQSLAPAVEVGRNPDMDAHKNPHLLIDSEGYLYIFFRAHCTPTHLVKSARPFDITDWRPMGVVVENSSYPQPWQLKAGQITVLYRGGGTHDATESFVVSGDGGQTWSQPQAIVTPEPNNGCYAVSIAENGPYPRKVHMAWSLTRGDWWQRYHVFYASSDDGGSTWKRSDGAPYTLPITEPTSQLVFESEAPDRGVWLKDIQLDSKGNPYILFVDGNTLTYDCVWRLAGCSGGKWSLYEVAKSDHMYDGGSLVILSDNDFRIYAPTTASQPYEDGGEMDEWQSTDGGRTWTAVKRLTSGSQFSHNHVKTVFNHGRGDFRVFWSYGDARVPPESRHVDLYRYGEAMPAPKKMELAYSPGRMPGRFLRVGQEEKIESVIRARGFASGDFALEARAMPGPPQLQHPMLAARIDERTGWYSAGLPNGRGKLYRYAAGWKPLAEAPSPTISPGWHQWSFRALGDRLQFAVGGQVLVEARDTDFKRGGVGARVWSTSLYLDDIRVRKLALPEAAATIKRP
ncbi:MAG: DUF2341 domain-containing protein [Pirellulales bacterium]|nr:DUF2341 domain-containing protein [Pirellulales bacterium]